MRRKQSIGVRGLLEQGPLDATAFMSTTDPVSGRERTYRQCLRIKDLSINCAFRRAVTSFFAARLDYAAAFRRTQRRSWAAYREAVAI